MEKEVVEMRNSFKEKEKTLTEERDKAIKAAEYVEHFFFDHNNYGFNWLSDGISGKCLKT